MSSPVESNTDRHDHQHHATYQSKLDRVEELKYPPTDERISGIDSSIENTFNNNDDFT